MAHTLDHQGRANDEKLIAIVEDDASLAQMFRDMLYAVGHWKGEFFADGQDALARLPELGAHLILLDMSLPGLDGVSLYKQLRGHNNTRDTPIIVITASHDWELRRMGLHSGLLLQKPFEMRELLFMIQTLLA